MTERFAYQAVSESHPIRPYPDFSNSRYQEPILSDSFVLHIATFTRSDSRRTFRVSQSANSSTWVFDLRLGLCGRWDLFSGRPVHCLAVHVEGLHPNLGMSTRACALEAFRYFDLTVDNVPYGLPRITSRNGPSYESSCLITNKSTS